MARKRKVEHRAKRYLIKHGSLQHEVSPRAFAVWLRDGLLVAIHSHLAHVSEAARTLWDGGELILQPRQPAGVSLRTNAQAIDDLYPLAHSGQVPLDRETRLMFAQLRLQLGEDAEPLIQGYLANERQFALRAQYGWL